MIAKGWLTTMKNMCAAVGNTIMVMVLLMFFNIMLSDGKIFASSVNPTVNDSTAYSLNISAFNQQQITFVENCPEPLCVSIPNQALTPRPTEIKDILPSQHDIEQPRQMADIQANHVFVCRIIPCTSPQNKTPFSLLPLQLSNRMISSDVDVKFPVLVTPSTNSCDITPAVSNSVVSHAQISTFPMQQVAMLTSESSNQMAITTPMAMPSSVSHEYSTATIIAPKPGSIDDEVVTDTDDLYVTKEQLNVILKEQSVSTSPFWKKGLFTITPYGYINVSTSYETERTVNGDFALYSLSPELDGGGHPGFHIDPKSSRLGLKIAGPDMPFNGYCLKTNGLFEVDFQGANYAGTRNRGALMLRRAFVDFSGKSTKLLIGQEWEVISPLVPQSLNYVPGSYAGNLGYRRAQIRLEHNRDWSNGINTQWQFAVCDNVPCDYIIDTNVNKANSGWPMLQGRFAVAFDNRSNDNIDPVTIGVSGHIGEMTNNYSGLQNVSSLTKYRHETWSANIDVDLPLTQRLRLSGEAYTGSNLSSSLAGIGQGIDFFRSTNGSPDPRSLDGSGTWGNINFKISKKFQMNTGYCVEKMDGAIGTTKTSTPDVYTARDKNQVIFLNGIYNWTEYLMTGLEVSQWRTDWHKYDYNPATQSGVIIPVEPGETTRVDFLVRYSF